MRAIVNEDLVVMALDKEYKCISSTSKEIAHASIDQYEGDEVSVIVRKDRESLIFCERMGIGYWVGNELITVK